MRGKDFDASAILSEFKRINVDWGSVPSSGFESLLRGQKTSIFKGNKCYTLMLQKGISGYVLKSALSVVNAITEAGESER